MTRGLAYADRAEWLELRRNGIGGSDAAAILGVSPWTTAVDVWEEKVTAKPETEPSVRMMWGRRLEDVVADALVEERGLRLRRVNRILVHDEYPFVLGSVDRMTRDSVVEIKVARSASEWATEEEAPDLPPIERVPRHYYVQGQHYAAVTRKPTVLFGVLVGGNDLRLIETPADPDFIDDLMTAEVAFWRDYVETGVRPPLEGRDSKRLAKLYPTGSGEKIATPEVDALVRRLLDVRDREDAAKKERADLEVAIEAYLGEDASDLVSSVTKVTWRPGERTKVEWEEIAGGLRSAIDRMRRSDDRTIVGELDRVLSEGFGTTDLDEVERLFTTKTPTRTLRVDRKGATR